MFNRYSQLRCLICVRLARVTVSNLYVYLYIHVDF